MSASPFAKSLNNGKAPIYLLHGDESFLTRKAMAWLREAVLNGGLEDFNLDRFDAAEKVDQNRIVEAARTLPMMAERRLVWVRHAEVLFEQGADQVKALAAYLDTPEAEACLVFEAASSVRKTSTLFKRMSKHGCVLESVPLRDRELPAWIRTQAETRGRKLDAEAASALAEAIGADLASLDAAVERLCLFVEGKAVILRGHVEAMVPHTRTHNVFELTSALADRNLGKVLDHAHQLMEQGEHPLKLMSMVVWQLRRLLIGRAARARGLNDVDAASAAGVRGYQVANFIRQLENFSGPELLKALNRLAEVDRALKGSKLPAELIFEAALVDLCAR